MSKIIISSKLKSNTQEEYIDNKAAILKDNKIYYSNDDTNSIITLKSDKVIIERKNSRYDILLVFEKNKKLEGKYYVKDLNIDMKISTKTKKIQIDENSVLLEYIVYINDIKSDDIKYEIRWRGLV